MVMRLLSTCQPSPGMLSDLLLLQVKFPVDGLNTFLAADEKKPFEILQLVIKRCLTASPDTRATMDLVARGLYTIARQAGWC